MGVVKLTTTLSTVSHKHKPSLLSHSICCFNSCSLLYSNRRSSRSCIRSLKLQWTFKRKGCGICSALKDYGNGDGSMSKSDTDTDIWKDPKCIEVIGIGNRVDPVLDFCLRSPSHPHPLRFWNIIRNETFRAQLQQKSLGRDDNANIVEVPMNNESYSKAVVLVASAGYGDDCAIATDILRAIRSGGGLVVAVVIKPFGFEGQRRQDEVRILVDRLQSCVNFYIEIDIDTLLKMDLVTLDEALKTAYTAVSSAINAVSVLASDNYKKYIHSLHGGVRQINVTEAIKVLESYEQAKVGFGFGNDVEASVMQAVYDCPFLSLGLKDFDGIVICILSSSSALGDKDVRSLHTFRQATDCTKDVILSVVLDPEMKPNLIGTIVITICVAEKKSSQKTTLLTRLADSFPFVFNFLRRNHMQSDTLKGSKLREDVFDPMLANVLEKNDMPNTVPVEGKNEDLGILSRKDLPLDENYDKKEYYDDASYGTKCLEASGDLSKYLQQNAEGAEALERELVIDRNFGPVYRIAEDWAEDLNSSVGVPVADIPKVFNLPVGVRHSDDLQETFDWSNSRQTVERMTSEDGQVVETVPSVSPMNGVTDAGLEVVTDFWNNASTLLRGKQLDITKKQGGLSARAASMLEAERDTKTRWSPVVEIRYRGGVYKGRCQGGLPEGRGRLTCQDGSVYDGMWRYGKRSGIGSLFFCNGDVFHGSWRDDLMHGKGWLYFHSGERWFANFWKGRANGEGRFYSKSGEVLFGQFQDGWRHGHFLCINVDGARHVEIWHEGVLVSSEELHT